MIGGNGASQNGGVNDYPHFSSGIDDIYTNPLQRTVRDSENGNTLCESTDRTFSSKRGGKRRINTRDTDGKNCDKCCTIF